MCFCISALKMKRTCYIDKKIRQISIFLAFISLDFAVQNLKFKDLENV